MSKSDNEPSDEHTGPDPFSEQIEAGERKAKSVREQVQAWHTFMAKPWAGCTLDAETVRKLQQEPALWLGRAVDVMAFGSGSIPNDDFESGARRRQASRALCEGARLAKFALIGSHNTASTEAGPIEREYFDFPRQLAGAPFSNALELDAELASDDVITNKTGDRRFNVRVNTTQFLDWLEAPPVPDAGQALEEAAQMLESQSTNDMYRKAWNAAAKLIRGMKPG